MKNTKTSQRLVRPSVLDYEQYLWLVGSVVARMIASMPPHTDVDMLTSAGQMGLLSAFNSYKAAGAAFETYARVRIRGEILDELRRWDFVPKWVRSRAKKLGVEVPVSFIYLDVLGPEGNSFDIPDESPHPALQIDITTIREVIRSLPPRMRDVLDGHYFANKTVKEIAAQEGVSGFTVYQTLRAGLHECRMALSDKWSNGELCGGRAAERGIE